MTILLQFDPDEAEAGRDFFRACVEEQPRDFRGEHEPPVLRDEGLASVLVYARDLAIVMAPIVLLWLGKGKQLLIRHRSGMYDLRNYTAEEVRALLEALDAMDRSPDSKGGAPEEPPPI